MKYRCKKDVMVSRGCRAFTQGKKYEAKEYPEKEHPEYGNSVVMTNDFDRVHIIKPDFLAEYFEAA